LRQKLILLIFMLLPTAAYHAQTSAAANDEQKIRELIGRWDAAYRAMDGKAIAALETPDFELVNRFGDWYPQTSRAENERMWNWAFANVYQGKPGPKHAIERIRFIHPESAIVVCSAFWAETITLPDGQKIPPHGQTTTFTVVKTKTGWQIAAQTVHNKISGDGPAGNAGRDKLPWNQKP
jgi:uncharacterized protein (TIGR02246 family)